MGYLEQYGIFRKKMGYFEKNGIFKTIWNSIWEYQIRMWGCRDKLGITQNETVEAFSISAKAEVSQFLASWNASDYDCEVNTVQ